MGMTNGKTEKIVERIHNYPDKRIYKQGMNKKKFILENRKEMKKRMNLLKDNDFEIWESVKKFIPYFNERYNEFMDEHNLDENSFDFKFLFIRDEQIEEIMGKIDGFFSYSIVYFPTSYSLNKSLYDSECDRFGKDKTIRFPFMLKKDLDELSEKECEELLYLGKYIGNTILHGNEKYNENLYHLYRHHGMTGKI